MFVDVRPRKRNAPRPAEKSAPGFLQWLRGRECLVGLAIACDGKIQAAHVDYAGDKGIGTKVSDRFTVPLCQRHHALQHQHGWQSFERTWFGGRGEGTALRAAEQYWRAWPGRLAWERKTYAS
jgi:hypothetical protein